MVGIRADANEEISIGHLMRCLSIADELRIMGETVVFLTSDIAAGDIIIERGHKNISLTNDYKNKDAEIERIAAEIKKHNISRFLLDSYEVTPKYMESLCNLVPLVYIDDIVNFAYQANVIVNYAAEANRSLYLNCCCDDYLLGSRYAPIRREFRQTRRYKNSGIKSVFISSGGSDHYDMVIRIVENILCNTALETIFMNVVVGKYYKNNDKLDSIARENSHRMKIYHNIQDVWNVMAQSDLAISASGTTVAELCTMGIPVINYITADNQKNGVNSLLRNHALVYAGDVREGINGVTGKIIESIHKFIDKEIDYEFYSGKGREMYDGLGAKRIAEKIAGIGHA